MIYYIVLCYIKSYYIILYYIILYHIALYCIILYYIIYIYHYIYTVTYYTIIYHNMSNLPTRPWPEPIGPKESPTCWFGPAGFARASSLDPMDLTPGGCLPAPNLALGATLTNMSYVCFFLNKMNQRFQNIQRLLLVRFYEPGRKRFRMHQGQNSWTTFFGTGTTSSNSFIERHGNSGVSASLIGL